MVVKDVTFEGGEAANLQYLLCVARVHLLHGRGARTLKAMKDSLQGALQNLDTAETIVNRKILNKPDIL